MKLKDLFKDSGQITRVIILTAIVLVLVVASFGSYYYYDRYVDTSGNISPIEQSVTELEQGVRDDPADMETRLALAETYMFSGRYDDAISLAQQIVNAAPENERALFVLGISSASSNRYELAIEPLKKFVEIRDGGEMSNMDKALETALYFLGDSYLQLEEAENAIPVLVRALEINRTDADAMYKLGLAYAATNQHEEALASYENAIRFVPDFIEVYHGMIDSYEALNMSLQATYARGMLAYAKKDYKTARTELEQVVSTDAGFSPAYLGLGLTYEQLGDYENALAYADLALQIDSENLAAVQLKGRVEAALGK